MAGSPPMFSIINLFSPDVPISEAGCWIAIAWLFVLGAAIGSFLNVVVYRLPRGMSLLWPGSRCPTCGHAIRWHDNLPIVGWLVLGGRCRDCGARISPRYPIVEALVAVTSAILARNEVFQTIAPSLENAGGQYALEFGPYLLHMLLVCTLLSAALIQFDGRPVSPYLLGMMLLVGLAVTFAWPNVQLDEAVGQWVLRGVPESVSGLLVAAWSSLLAWPAWVRGGQPHEVADAGNDACALVLVGVYLGLRAVVFACSLSLACFAIAPLAARWIPGMGRVGWIGWLFAWSSIWMIGWRAAIGFLPLWIDRNQWTFIAAASAVVAVLALVARRTHRAAPASISTADA
jgi:leader peptidase (prepilin peptidase) / N-methyltransferase